MNLSITNECNRRCEYCFQKSWYLSNKNNPKKEMDLSMIEKILQMMRPEEHHFSLLGGEPLLYSDLSGLFDILRKYEKKVNMISNISVDKSIIEDILKNHQDVVESWLINTDYPEAQKELFLDNVSLFKDYPKFSLSTTLLPDTKKIIESAERILTIIKILQPKTKDDLRIRVSPMAPNHTDDRFYDYSLDIIKFIEKVWETGILYPISFDCTLNACEISPEVMDMFDNFGEEYVQYRTQRCGTTGPFDILVDGSCAYCSSTYNLIKLDNIIDYENMDKARFAMSKKWKDYWKFTGLLCDYKNCNRFNPSYCSGLCPAKNTVYQHILNK